MHPTTTLLTTALKQLTRPYQIAAVARNYLSHINELNNARPTEPFFFLKAPSTLLHAGDGPVLIPRDSNTHYEVELGVIIGKDIDCCSAKKINGDEKRFQHAVSKKDVAGAPIGGYCLGIDMTSRTYQDKAKKAGLPWTLAKNLKTFTPISAIIPRSALPPFPWLSDSVRLHLSVNGVERQNDPISLMLTKIPALIEHVSSVMPLYRHDLLLTGTPKGVGEVKGGDRMEAWISVDGKVLEQSRIEVGCEWRKDGYGSQKVGDDGVLWVRDGADFVRLWKTTWSKPRAERVKQKVKVEKVEKKVVEAPVEKVEEKKKTQVEVPSRVWRTKRVEKAALTAEGRLFDTMRAKQPKDKKKKKMPTWVSSAQSRSRQL